jgi:hypothetical protein
MTRPHLKIWLRVLHARARHLSVPHTSFELPTTVVLMRVHSSAGIKLNTKGRSTSNTWWMRS